MTGVEAIANAVPSFKKPRVRSAQRAEVALGILLGTMLIGLAVLIEKFSLAPVPGTTVLSQLTSAALGNGVGYYVVQFSTVILLALAANTSYGGLPNLMRILADDNVLPHRFSRKSTRDVFTYGVLSLGGVGALLLVGSGGNMNTLVPLFAIGVFIGFTLAQFGMVRHWLAERTPGWKWRLALNGFGAVLTSIAAVVTTAMKFTEGAWLIALALPALVLGMERIRGAYTHIGARLTVQSENASLSIGYKPAVLVPVSEITSLSTRAMAAATAMSSAHRNSSLPCPRIDDGLHPPMASSTSEFAFDRHRGHREFGGEHSRSIRPYALPPPRDLCRSRHHRPGNQMAPVPPEPTDR
ncbi:APC family permease [Rhodococcus sp. 3Y1]